MVKNAYPCTTHRPVQVLDFVLQNDMVVRAEFSPEPSVTQADVVGHVEIEVTMGDDSTQVPLPPQSRPQTMLVACGQAYQFAESQSNRIGSPIIEARLQGEEFLEVSDVVQITGNAFPVTTY